MITDGNCQKEYWEFFFGFEMSVAQIDPNDNKSSVLDMEVDPVTATDSKFWKRENQLLDALLRTIPTRYQVANRVGNSHIDQ